MKRTRRKTFCSCKSYETTLKKIFPNAVHRKREVEEQAKLITALKTLQVCCFIDMVETRWGASILAGLKLVKTTLAKYGGDDYFLPSFLEKKA
ncbi:MAG: hypothetical protein ACK4UN_22365 [Limisphaerales bacterium]